MAYPNLAAEMTRNGVTEKDIATAVSKSTDTVKNWMKGKGDFPIGKAFTVQETFFPSLSIAYLFSTKPAAPQALEK